MDVAVRCARGEIFFEKKRRRVEKQDVPAVAGLYCGGKRALILAEKQLFKVSRGSGCSCW
jgi:hypothetical protein